MDIGAGDLQRPTGEVKCWTLDPGSTLLAETL